MSKIAIHIGHPLVDGEQITFKAPCNSADATGLRIYTPTSYEDETETSAVYTMKDAGGDTVHRETGLFTSGAYVTVTLDTTNTIAYIHNAKTVYKADLQDSLKDRVRFTTDTLNDVYIYGSEDADQNLFTGLEFHTGANTNQRYRLQQGSTGNIVLYRRKADNSGWDSVYSGNLPNSIVNITRSGTTFTATRGNGTTFTFTQQDNNTWTANALNTAGYVGAPSSSTPRRFWSTDNSGNPAWRNNINYVAPTSSSGGSSAGLVPALSGTYYDERILRFLRGDGGWTYIPLANNATTTAEHIALDARMGKTLSDKFRATTSGHITANNDYCKSGTVWWAKRTGTGIVQLLIDVYLKSNINTESVAYICTGLPKNAMSGSSVKMSFDDSSKDARVNIDDNGKLWIWYMGNPLTFTTSGHFYGSVVYLTSD